MCLSASVTSPVSLGDPGKSRFGFPAEYTLVRDHHQTKRVSHTHTLVFYVYTHGIDRAHVHGTYEPHMIRVFVLHDILDIHKRKHKTVYVYVHEIDRAHVHGTYGRHMIRV